MQTSNESITLNPDNTNTDLLQKLSKAVNGHAATATFACGGSIPIAIPIGPSRDLLGSCPPVTIRYDDEDPAAFKKATFPVFDEERFLGAFHHLLMKTLAATFGLGGEDVLDETYRKARKLDPKDFSTNFHPHNVGIMVAVQQILMPSCLEKPVEVGDGTKGIRAELYKLNGSIARTIFLARWRLTLRVRTGLLRAEW